MEIRLLPGPDTPFLRVFPWEAQFSAAYSFCTSRHHHGKGLSMRAPPFQLSKRLFPVCLSGNLHLLRLLFLLTDAPVDLVQIDRKSNALPRSSEASEQRILLSAGENRYRYPLHKSRENQSVIIAKIAQHTEIQIETSRPNTAQNIIHLHHLKKNLLRFL